MDDLGMWSLKDNPCQSFQDKICRSVVKDSNANHQVYIQNEVGYDSMNRLMSATVWVWLNLARSLKNTKV